MTTCLEFRRRVGAEPFADDAAIAAHRQDCPACARHQDDLRGMDAVIRRALEVNAAAPAASGREPAAGRRRVLAIAASLVAGAAIGIVLLVSAPRESIAREVVAHLAHEPDAVTGKSPLAPEALAEVLGPEGVSLRPDAGEVTFAARCVVEGRVVPHLVVRTAQGPVTVFLLRNRMIAAPLRLREDGYEGRVMPAPRGSIAIVGQGVRDIDAIARQVVDAIDWGG